jgi:hypothetical protein
MPTVIIDMAAIAGTREKILRQDPTVKAPLEHLLTEVGHALAMRAPSVMDKKMTPPSGDMHDYMSVGTYWWPNPDRPDGIPWVRRDGEVNPSTQGHDFDYLALSQMSRAVIDLAIAFRLTEEPSYALKAAELLKTWFLNADTRMNPHLNFGQAVPGINTGRGIGIIDTACLVSLLDAVELLDGAPGWTPFDMKGMRAWFEAYLTWLLESPHGLDEAQQKNNHGTWYDAQVARFALFAGHHEQARRTLKAAFNKRIVPQVRPDGSQPHELARTRSLDYSVFNLSAMLILCLLGNRLEVPLAGRVAPDGTSIQKALDFLAPYAAPQLPWPHPQIHLEGGRSAMVLLLRLGYSVYGDPRYVDALLLATPDSRDQDSSILYITCPV